MPRARCSHSSARAPPSCPLLNRPCGCRVSRPRGAPRATRPRTATAPPTTCCPRPATCPWRPPSAGRTPAASTASARCPRQSRWGSRASPRRGRCAAQRGRRAALGTSGTSGTHASQRKATAETLKRRMHKRGAGGAHWACCWWLACPAPQSTIPKLPSLERGASPRGGAGGDASRFPALRPSQQQQQQQQQRGGGSPSQQQPAEASFGAPSDLHESSSGAQRESVQNPCRYSRIWCRHLSLARRWRGARRPGVGGAVHGGAEAAARPSSSPYHPPQLWFRLPSG